MTYEEFVLEYTNHDMDYHRRYGTTGIEFGRECWEKSTNQSRADLDRLHRERDAFQEQCRVMAEENARVKAVLDDAHLLATGWASHYKHIHHLEEYHPEHQRILDACRRELGL